MLLKNKLSSIIVLVLGCLLLSSCFLVPAGIYVSGFSIGFELSVFSDKDFNNPLNGICCSIRETNSKKILAKNISTASGVLDYSFVNPGEDKNNFKIKDNEVLYTDELQEKHDIYDDMNAPAESVTFYRFILNDPELSGYNAEYETRIIYFNELDEWHHLSVHLKKLEK